MAVLLAGDLAAAVLLAGDLAAAVVLLAGDLAAAAVFLPGDLAAVVLLAGDLAAAVVLLTGDLGADFFIFFTGRAVFCDVFVGFSESSEDPADSSVSTAGLLANLVFFIGMIKNFWSGLLVFYVC